MIAYPALFPIKTGDADHGHHGHHGSPLSGLATSSLSPPYSLPPTMPYRTEINPDCDNTETNLDDVIFSPIRQLDGVYDLDTPEPRPPMNVRAAPYILDRNKQISKLANDANLDDFEIVVSPTEHNVNIFCSTGFYSLVAIPAFSSISTHFSATVAGMSVSCYEITSKNDGAEAVVNTVYFFRLGTKSKSSVAKVTIHLHHTQRKVQVQGGALVDNRIRAGVWFVQNFLLNTFSKVSQERSLDIKRFNSAVKEMVDTHIDKISEQQQCKVCEIPFTGRSQRQTCSVCNHKYHKGCFTHTNHSCIGAGSSKIHQSSSTPAAPPVSNPLQPLPDTNNHNAETGDLAAIFSNAFASMTTATTRNSGQQVEILSLPALVLLLHQTKTQVLQLQPLHHLSQHLSLNQPLVLNQESHLLDNLILPSNLLSLSCNLMVALPPGTRMVTLMHPVQRPPMQDKKLPIKGQNIHLLLINQLLRRSV